MLAVVVTPASEIDERTTAMLKKSNKVSCVYGIMIFFSNTNLWNVKIAELVTRLVQGLGSEIV